MHVLEQATIALLFAAGGTLYIAFFGLVAHVAMRATAWFERRIQEAREAEQSFPLSLGNHVKERLIEHAGSVPCCTSFSSP